MKLGTVRPYLLDLLCLIVVFVKFIEIAANMYFSEKHVPRGMNGWTNVKRG